jgi:hypothetical protein
VEAPRGKYRTLENWLGGRTMFRSPLFVRFWRGSAASCGVPTDPPDDNRAQSCISLRAPIHNFPTEIFQEVDCHRAAAS